MSTEGHKLVGKWYHKIRQKNRKNPSANAKRERNAKVQQTKASETPKRKPRRQKKYERRASFLTENPATNKNRESAQFVKIKT